MEILRELEKYAVKMKQKVKQRTFANSHSGVAV
jgi:hypothetical protein